MNPTNFQLALQSAAWIDVNTNFSINELPDRLPDDLAISVSSLTNLFNCPIGARSRTFQPEYGSLWYQFLQEPIDDITSAAMTVAMIQAIARWEPRIKLNQSLTTIKPDVNIPGYVVTIAGSNLISKKAFNISFIARK